MENVPLKRISVVDVSKAFNIGFRKDVSALARVLSSVSGKEARRPLLVADHISFEANAGENIGLIGKNGSGKSTLLRLIAGIYSHDSGTIETDGEKIYINGFGFGLEKRLTMRENIFLIGIIMGLSQREIKERFDDIVSFSGLADFVDTKVYQFSSGMVSRLRFSITIHCLKQRNPDILLLDEVFGSGGDLSFQNEAVLKMEEFIRGGATVVLVSHDLKIIEKYCDRVIWLDRGKVKQVGMAAEVIAAYQDSINKKSSL